MDAFTEKLLMDESHLELSGDSSSDIGDSDSDGFEEISDSGLNIGKDEVERSYSLLGVPVQPDPSSLVLSELREKYPSAFSEESELLLQCVLRETALPFPELSDFQVFCINALLTHHNLLCVTPTGSGKSIIMYMFALCIKKLYPKGLVVVGMPLSSLIMEQHTNTLAVPILTLTMGAKIQGTVVEAMGEPTLSGLDGGGGVSKDISVEEACSGKYGLLCGHPEALSAEPGQQILRRMAREGMINGVMVDEVHQGGFL